jgi:hypothetical protein
MHPLTAAVLLTARRFPGLSTSALAMAVANDGAYTPATVEGEIAASYRAGRLAYVCGWAASPWQA